MEDSSFSVIPNLCSTRNIKNTALLKIYDSFKIVFIPFAVHTLNFSFFISSNSNSLESQLQDIAKESKFITYMYHNLYQSVYLSQKNRDKIDYYTDFGIDLIICNENYCSIFEKVDVNVVDNFFSKIKAERSIAIIDASCKSNNNDDENKQIKKEIENFCAHFMVDINQNKFVECTIRPIACYMIRRFFYPTCYFNDQRFFKFNYQKENTKKKTLLYFLTSFMNSDDTSKSVYFYEELQSVIEEEGINNNEKPDYQYFHQKDFIILRIIYTNDTSIFFLVFHIETFHIFLLKKIATLDPSSSSFINEVTFCKKYSHRCFMHFYGFLMKNNNIQGFVYQYLCNDSLISYVLSHEQTETELYALISINRIFQGIDYLHKNSLIYRDFKPLNILIDHDFYPYITDFETIRMIDIENETQTLTNDIGSPLYYSPEQYRGDADLSFSSDIYSFGLIIYYLFEKKDLKSVFNLHLDEKDQEIPLPHASENLQKVFQSCIKFAPNDRMTHDEIKAHIIEEMSSLNYLEKYLNNNSKDISPSVYIFVYETIRILSEYPEKLSIYLDNLFHYLIIRMSYDYYDCSDCFLNFGDILLRYKSNKNIILAIKYYDLAAQLNNSKAALNLGNIYLKGLIVNQNYQKAKEYYELAANLKDSEAQFKLGFIYHKGLGVKQDYTKAKEYYELAAKQKHSEALLKLGNLYKKGHGVNQSYTEARKYYALSSQQDNASAQNKLGELYLFGHGTNKSISKALKQFTKSAEGGNAKAYKNLGDLYYNDEDVEFDISKAIHYYKKAAQNKNPDALLRLGKIFLNGEYVKQNYIKAKEYFELAAEKGNSKALIKLGKIYYYGYGFDKNHKKAKEYFELAAKKDNPKGLVFLGAIYYFGYGVEKNITNSIKYMELAAKKNYPKALYFLGSIYLNYGDCNVQYYDKAIEYLELAAKNNSSDALFLLGEIYMSSEFSGKNYEKAIEYLKLAAEDENTDALRKLGMLYYNGEGVKQNYLEAKKYFELAVENEDKQSLYYLAIIYKKGLGTPKDYSRAKYYLNLLCEMNFSYAFVEIGDFLFLGFDGKPNYEKAKEYYEIAAQNSSVSGYLRLGILYFNGYGVKQNYLQSKKYYELAARNYHPYALYMLGKFYFYGYCDKKDLNLAMKYFELAAYQKDTNSMILLSDYFCTYEFNISKAIQYLTNCCEIENVEYDIKEDKEFIISYRYFNFSKYISFNDLGLIYIIILNDITKATDCIKEAAFAEYPFGQNNFGLLNQFYLNEIGNAEYMYKRASEHNFALAEFNLGYLNEKNIKNDNGITYYIRTSEHEDVKLTFKDKERDDINLEISLLFILCLTNLKITNYFFSISNFEESKKYFKKSFIKFTTIDKNIPYSFEFGFNKTNALNPFSYLKEFILNFPLFDLKNQSNLSSEIKNQINSSQKQQNKPKSIDHYKKDNNYSNCEKENIVVKYNNIFTKILNEKESRINFNIKFDKNGNDSSLKNTSCDIDGVIFKDPDQLFDFVILNKKYQSILMNEIKEIIQIMETITYTPPYPILFGRLNLTKSRQKETKSCLIKDINELFYKGFE